jgi:flagellin
MVGINSNFAASAATRNLGIANDAVSSSIAKLSSGNRIIKASDDVAGLAIGTSIATTVKTLQISLLNAQQATSVLSIADGALNQVGDILARQKSLATQANSGSLGSTERGYLAQEFNALKDEIDQIVGSTTFNGITLLNGTLGANTSGKDVSNAPTFGTDGGSAGSALYTGTIGTSVVNSTSELAFTNDNGNGTNIGSTADIKVSGVYNANNVVFFTINLGGVSYNSGQVNLATANANVALTFTNPDDSGATIKFNIKTYAIPGSQANVSTIAAGIQDDLSGLTIYQKRAFGTGSTGITADSLVGTVLEGLSGADFTLKGTSFDTTGNTAPVVGAFNATAETTTTDGKLSTTIGGVTYSTVVGQFDSTKTDLQAGDSGGGTGVIRLYKDGDATANPEDYLDIDVASNAALDNTRIDSLGSATLLTDALNTAFGVGSNGALSFQIGSNTTDSIGVSINSVLTNDIYKDDDGNYVDININTQTDAQTASSVLDNAIASVISRRADVGAGISRFNFASSNLQVSIANQDSARGSFLDADIAEESTNFASAQVRLQASTSVLAQANALPRDLLRLLQ